jgi:hypothetical protein
MPFRLHNRIDVLDNQKRWLEAIIVDLAPPNKMQVRFRGFAPRYDEWIDFSKEPNRILEVGSLSNGEGWAKYSAKH